MLLQNEDVIHQPAEIVYPLVRDHMVKLIPYLPNIDRIEVLKHERLDEKRVEVVNNWFAKAEVPALVKKFVKPELFSWKDFAMWKDDEFCVDYRLESFMGNDIYDARGTNYFVPEGTDKTRIRVTCNITIYPDKIPGVPRILAKQVLPTIEGMIRKILEPNLTSLGQGLTRYFSDPANRP
jgi:hypothetical protein